ncbi:hypothetical protein DFH09DRAFT_1182549 [Mycena vulgaris]|nr:hypothetical protein DFH09DRAFT_1182549 [Mycena vulgaris]
MLSTANLDLRTRLAEVHASIAEHKLRLEELDKTRRTIQRQLDLVVYPVLTLPSEITSNIFLESLPPSLVFPEDVVKAPPNPSNAPLLLLRICRQWRSIAIATPRLWVDLHLNLDTLKWGNELEKAIVEWFRRAGSCPLSFSVWGFYMKSAESKAIRDTLVRYAPQLERVALQLSQRKFKQLVGIGPFPILEQLLITLPFMKMEDDQKLQGLDIFSDAPRLDQLYFGKGAKPSMFSPSRTALTELTCERLSGDEFLDSLELAPSLTQFICSVVPKALKSHKKIITHNHLQTLRLVTTSSVHFLPLVRAPALQDLHLHIDDRNADEDSLLPFLTSASTSLRTFSTGGSIKALKVGWFSAMSGLTEIIFCTPSQAFLPHFVDRLVRPRNPTFLPQLQFLEIADCEFRVDALIPALTSRLTAGDGAARLQTFHWTTPQGFATRTQMPNFHDELKKLVASGMNVGIGPGVGKVNYLHPR